MAEAGQKSRGELIFTQATRACSSRKSRALRFAASGSDGAMCPRSDVWLFGVGGRVVTIDQQAAAADRGWAARTRRRASHFRWSRWSTRSKPQTKFCRHQSCQRRGEKDPRGQVVEIAQPAIEQRPISRSFCRATTRWCCTKRAWAVTKPEPRLHRRRQTRLCRHPAKQAAAGRSARRAAQKRAVGAAGSSGDKLPGPTGQKADVRSLDPDGTLAHQAGQRRGVTEQSSGRAGRCRGWGRCG